MRDSSAGNGRVDRGANALRAVALCFAIVAMGFGAAPLSAQGGWLGLGLEFEDDTGSAGARETVVVLEVAEDSPAERAGILEDDVLLEIRGEPASEDALEDLVRTVDPGDSVEVVLLRGDERLSLVVEAGERPSSADRIRVLVRELERPVEERRELVIRLDSIKEAVEVLNRDRLGRVRIRMDSLTEALERGALDIEGFERAIERSEIARAEALSDLEDRLLILGDSIDVLSFRMERAFPDWNPEDLDAAVRGLVIPEFDVVVPDFDGDWNEAVIGWGGVSPLVVGRRVVAGAELVDLNASLARYFDVDGGALVVDVVERSPAGQAGVEPGDVIVEVNGEPVEDLAGVRERFARLSFSPFFGPDAEPEDPVTITVVRGSDRLEIELRE